MTSQHSIDPAEAAQITENLDRAFDFMRDVIDDPYILETIPDGSMLIFRNISLDGQIVRLIAFLPKQPGVRWGARVSGVVPLDAPLAARGLGSDGPSVGGYETADAALDALEAEIRLAEPSRWISRRAVGA